MCFKQWMVCMEISGRQSFAYTSWGHSFDMIMKTQKHQIRLESSSTQSSTFTECDKVRQGYFSWPSVWTLGSISNAVKRFVRITVNIIFCIKYGVKVQNWFSKSIAKFTMNSDWIWMYWRQNVLPNSSKHQMVQ